MSTSDPVVIVAAQRSPIGNFLGQFKTLTAPELAAQTYRGLFQKLPCSPPEIHEVLTGCVLQAGMGQAPARQAALAAGLPNTICATTLNKLCGSGMKAVMLGYDAIMARPQHVILASGMESMTQAPFLLKKARAGYRLGHEPLYDHLMLDGLEDAYHPGRPMGYFAEQTAKTYHITREIQDRYASHAMERTLQAQQHGAFDAEIVPIQVHQTSYTQDENPHPSKLEKLTTLPPVFDVEGTITAGNASRISDGAAALLLMRYSVAMHHHYPILARIVGHQSHAQAPEDFATAPIYAIQKLLKQINWSIHDVDLFEINEAFAVVAIAAAQSLSIPWDILNIHGGACALGHPIGASGTRIITTLIHALARHHQRRGIASLCIGGGEATAIALERMEHPSCL